MSKLFILGNGFDLVHKLRTGTEDFINILKTKPTYQGFTSAAVLLADYGVLWGEYEQSLSDLDIEELELDVVEPPDYLSDYERDREAVIQNTDFALGYLNNAIKESLYELSANANNQLKKVTRLLPLTLHPDDAVISFNYTSTLEQLYDIPCECEVIHIHGCAESEDELVFGFLDTTNCTEEYDQRWFGNMDIEDIDSDRDYYIDKQRESILAFYRSWQKPLQLCTLTAFLKRHPDVDTVVVFGHSMSAVDHDYFEIIEEEISPALWLVSSFNGDPPASRIATYSFSSKVKRFDSRDSSAISKALSSELH